MTQDANPQFTSLSNKMSGVVAAHKSHHAAIHHHASEHTKARAARRAKAKAEHDLMKDIPEGGIQ